MSETRAVIIRFEALDEKDSRALLDLIKEVVGEAAVAEAPASQPQPNAADTVDPEPSADQVAQEVWETVVRQSAAETLAKQHDDMASGKLPPISANPQVLQEKKESLRSALTKEGVKGAAAEVVKQAVAWVLS